MANKIINIIIFIAIFFISLNLNNFYQKLKIVNLSENLSEVKDPTINKWTEDFKELSNTDIKNIKIIYPSTKINYQKTKELISNIKHPLDFNSYKGTLGSCVQFLNQQVIVLHAIDKNIFIHELGHCSLNLTHSNNPTNIMYPEITKNNVNNWKSLLDNQQKDLYYQYYPYIQFFTLLTFLGILIIVGTIKIKKLL